MDTIVLALNYIVAFFSIFVTMFFLLLFLRYRKAYYKTPAPTGWEPTISILIPAYNEEEYLRGCLESVVAIQYPQSKLEIIVIDDGSDDGTGRIAREFEARGVQLLRRENGGKGAALNAGIGRAKGELIATMDADSYPAPDILHELLPLFETPDVAAVTAAVKIRPSRALLKELQRVEYLMILFSRRLLSFIDSVPVAPGPFSIFRASVFRKIGLFDEKNLVEDHEIALRIQSSHLKIRSSVSAEVYTEPPATIPELLQQRIRWQRGGLRNYWNYRYMINPRYGDFGVYFVPLNFATYTAFFVLLALLIYTSVASPYYSRYILLDSVMLGAGFFTFIWVAVALASIVFVGMAVGSFRNEKVGFRYIVAFVIFYWYLMLGYNVLTLWKEIRQAKSNW